MLRESESTIVRPSNLAGSKNATQKIRIDAERISFRELALFARRRKAAHFLSERTGADLTTAKRWLTRKSRAPDVAVYAVLADIFTRIK